MFFGLAVWIFFAGVAALIAERKGRSAIGFFALAFFLSPLIGIVAALMAEEGDGTETIGGKKRCPHCDELIRAAANTCRFCAKDLSAPKVAADANDAVLAKLIDRLEQSKPT